MVATSLAPAAAHSQQSLAQRIAEVQDTVELRFASRPGVCGNGEGSISIRSPGESESARHGDDWDYRCEPGPVRVRLTVSNGKVTGVRSYVGRPRDSVRSAGFTDLGVVGAREAADYFLELARAAGENVARKAIVPATLADSVTVWPRLIELARDGDRPIEVRKSALFWAGQGETPTSELLDLYGRLREKELKRHLIFVISQRDDSAAVDGLMDIVRNESDHALRKQAFFWLGQKDDPRVVRLLTSILEK